MYKIIRQFFCLFLFAAVLSATAQEKFTEPLFELKGHTEDIEALTYSPNGKYLVSAGWDNSIKVWDTETNTLVKDFKAHDAAVRCLAYNRDGKLMISGARDNSVKIWDSAWNTKHKFFGHQNTINAVMFDPKARFAYSGSADGVVKIWDLVKKAEPRTIKLANPVNSLAMNLTGADIYVATKAADILKLNTRGETTNTLVGHTDEVNSLAFALNNKYLLSGSSDHTAIIWDVSVAAKPKVFQTLKGHNWKITAVAFSYDSKYAVTGSTDGTVKLWDVQTGQELYSFEGKGTSVNAIAMSPDITRIASASRMGNEFSQDDKYHIYIWDSKVELQRAIELRMKKMREDSIQRLRDSVKHVQDSIKYVKDSLKKQQKLKPKNDKAPAPDSKGSTNPPPVNNKQAALPKENE